MSFIIVPKSRYLSEQVQVKISGTAVEQNISPLYHPAHNSYPVNAMVRRPPVTALEKEFLKLVAEQITEAVAEAFLYHSDKMIARRYTLTKFRTKLMESLAFISEEYSCDLLTVNFTLP